ncbi:MAG: diphosphomevalonate decarboxylase [Bacillota bacterium]
MKITAKAHPNIALIKYFGKKDPSNVLPYNDSLSITWDTFETVTSIEESDGFSFYLNGEAATVEDREKVKAFLSQFTKAPINVVVRSFNNFPTAAGLASSASAFAALSTAANRYFACDFDKQTLETLTRKGSGSAIRSLYGGANRFNRDGHVTHVEAELENYRLLVVVIDEDKKLLSSREAMRDVVSTSTLYQAFVDHSNVHVAHLETALKNGNFSDVGSISEENALAMHGAMLGAMPPIRYMGDASFRVIQFVRASRQAGYEGYFTMDAGPNVKILTTTKDVVALKTGMEREGYKVLGPLKPSKEGAHLL